MIARPLRVIGVDPGPVPGIVLLRFDEHRWWRNCGVDVVQCSARLVKRVLLSLLDEAVLYDEDVLVGTEAFVRSNIHVSHQRAATRTEKMVSELEDVFLAWRGDRQGGWRTRRAVEVKPWASDVRLAAAGVFDVTKGMRHARDGGRHAVFTAVADGDVRDPLSNPRKPTGARR